MFNAHLHCAVRHRLAGGAAGPDGDLRTDRPARYLARWRRCSKLAARILKNSTDNVDVEIVYSCDGGMLHTFDHA